MAVLRKSLLGVDEITEDPFFCLSRASEIMMGID